MKHATPKMRITSRAQLVHRIRYELEARGYPRVQMLLLVTLTGGSGFIASYTLLRLGIDALALRYFLAVGIAYLAFLVLLWIWLRAKPDSSGGIEDAIPDILDAVPQTSARTADGIEPGGGNFGGGGSSGHWDSPSEPLIELPEISTPDLDVAAEAEELAIPLAVLLFIATIVLTVVLASASVIWSAPILFAELIVDGVLSATLYRRLRRLEPRHWLQSALRRTIVPFAATALLAAAVGWGLSLHTPGARTLGEVFHAAE